MDSGKGRYIPKFLDAQPQFLWWEIDEFLILVFSLVIGMFFDEKVIMFSLGILIQKTYSKLKTGKQQGFLYHKLYSWGLLRLKSNLIKKGKIPFYYNKYFIK